jgi:hypothetical protein
VPPFLSMRPVHRSMGTPVGACMRDLEVISSLLYNMHLTLAGKKWIRQMVCGAFFLPMLVCITAFLINFIAIYYHASRAIPFTIMVCLLHILYIDSLVGRHLHLSLRYSPLDSGGHCCRSKRVRTRQLSLSS